MVTPFASVLLPTSLADDLRSAAEQAAPEECCGLLIGRRTAAGWRVEDIVPARNRHAEPRHAFLLDPATQFATLRRLREEGAGRVVIGHYHSHPNGRATPSPQDAAAVEDLDALWLILPLSPEGRSQAPTAWWPQAPLGQVTFAPGVIVTDPAEIP